MDDFIWGLKLRVLLSRSSVEKQKQPPLILHPASVLGVHGNDDDSDAKYMTNSLTVVKTLTDPWAAPDLHV